MISWFFGSVWAQSSTAILIIAGLCVAAYLFPPFRKWLLTGAAVLGALLLSYLKGARDQSKSDKAKREDMVREKEKEYNEIDTRPDDSQSVRKRLRDGDF
jgi:hypothetical protein